MRTTEAARYARWSALAAILLAVIVAGVYAHRAWQARTARKSAPPAVPATVQQRSAEFSFSKVEKDRTLFTVRASRATEFKGDSRSLLEDVWITIYGRTGQRFDNIHTRACDYVSDTGQIVCAGEVQMDLEGTAEAQKHPGQPLGGAEAGRVIHVETSNVSFDRESGEARTDRPVVFRFPYGEGRAAGVSYSSQAGVVRLLRDVELTLRQGVPAALPARPSPPSADSNAARSHLREPVTLTGGSLEYRKDTRTLRLTAPVRARQGHRELVAGELTLELDAGLRAHRLVARPASAETVHRPELRSAEPRGQALLSADEFVALFHPQGWVERVLAKGNVRGSFTGAPGDDRLEAQQLELEMLPRRNVPAQLTALGEVKAQSGRRGEQRRLETAALRLFFTAGKKSGEQRLERAESLARATVEWQASGTLPGKAEPQTATLRGQQLVAQFDEQSALRTLTGHNGVALERRLPGRPAQTSTSRDAVVQFGAVLGATGEWTQLEQSGDVRFREADRTAQAAHALLVRDTDTITLTGSVVLADPAMRTTAQSVSFNHRTAEIRAEGSVRSVELSPGRTGVADFAPQPAVLSANRLLANTSGGRAVYSGRARLWQGDSVIEADSIELLRDARQLNARGNVMAVVPQAETVPGGPRSTPAGAPAGRTAGRASPASLQTEKGPARAAGAPPKLWRIRAGTLAYWSTESRAHFEQGVIAQSQQGQINSAALDLYFSAAGPPGDSASTSGARQLVRAVASGGVTVRSGAGADERRGTADRADYTAADGKFVLSGGRPTLYDAFRGTTTGRQLTFYFADDTIVVDSEEGSRTLTRHRVEK